MAEVEFLDISSDTREDPRGFVFFPWQNLAKEPRGLLRTFHLVSIAPGEIRGNHFHPGHQEYLFTFHGQAVLLWQGPAGEIEERRLSGHHTLVRIPPGLAHALKNPGPDILYLMAWRERTANGHEGPETLSRPLTGQE